MAFLKDQKLELLINFIYIDLIDLIEGGGMFSLFFVKKRSGQLPHHLRLPFEFTIGWVVVIIFSGLILSWPAFQLARWGLTKTKLAKPVRSNKDQTIIIPEPKPPWPF